MILAHGVSRGNGAHHEYQAPEERHNMSPLRGLLIYSIPVPMTYVIGY